MLVPVRVHNPHVQAWSGVHLPLVRLFQMNAYPTFIANTSRERFVPNLVHQTRQGNFSIAVELIAFAMVELEISDVIHRRGFDASSSMGESADPATSSPDFDLESVNRSGCVGIVEKPSCCPFLGQLSTNHERSRENLVHFRTHCLTPARLEIAHR
jgi:hypothetical protein